MSHQLDILVWPPYGPGIYQAGPWTKTDQGYIIMGSLFSYELLGGLEIEYDNVTVPDEFNQYNAYTYTYDPVTGAVTPIPPPIVDITAGRKVANGLIDLWRGMANSISFPYLGKDFACDLLGRSDIDAIATTLTLTGAYPTGWIGTWTAMDGTTIPMTTQSQFNDFYQAMITQQLANFQHASDMKQLVLSAVYQSDLDALTW